MTCDAKKSRSRRKGAKEGQCHLHRMQEKEMSKCLHFAWRVGQARRIECIAGYEYPEMPQDQLVSSPDAHRWISGRTLSWPAYFDKLPQSPTTT
jgi:hypothetical protein